MYTFLLKPKWIGFHLLCLTAIVVMINLAFWQLRRLDEKQTFNDRVTSHTDADVVPLDGALLQGDADDLIYRRVEATGSYLREPQFEVVNVTQEGTTVSMSMPSIRSHAATQFDSGPAHTMGVPPMNRMSPVYTVFASGT